MCNKKLINWGSYDVDNFGDLLFPYLVEHYLSCYYSEIIHASPTGIHPIWEDAIPTCRISEALNKDNISGLLVGGGNLISWTTSSSVNYTHSAGFSELVHPSFFLIPYILRAKHNIPFAFNYIGVSKPIPVDKKHIVKTAIESASFISCREDAGKNHLRQCDVSSRIVVGLDSAINISRVFPPEKLTHHWYSNNVREKYGIPNKYKTAVIHIKQRYLKNQYNEISNIIKYLIKQGVHPILIPLGMCHKDELIFNDARFHAHTATVIRKPELVVDILSILSKSQYYIGSSLHGAIASLSYKNEILIVADEEDSRLSKFSGFLSQIDLTECLYKDWQNAHVNLLRSGLDIFKSIKETFICAHEHDPWVEIHNSLEIADRSVIKNHLDSTLEKAINDHYQI